MNKHPDVIAWESWLNSTRGRECARDEASGDYLKNRLWWAFMAGRENRMNDDVLFYAFRYALGRQTYAVNDVVAAIKKHAAEMQPKTRILMAREIEEAGVIKDEDVISCLWREALGALDG